MRNDPRRTLLSIRLLVATATLLAAPARASSGVTVGQVGVRAARGGNIPGLQLERSRFALRAVSLGKVPKLETTLEGRYPTPDWSLIIMPAGKVIERSADGTFRITLPLSRQRTFVTFLSIGPSGTALQASYEIRMLDWIGIQRRIRLAQRPSRYRWSVGAGLVSSTYTQDRVPNFSAVEAALRGTVEYRLVPEVWSLALSARLTPFALSASPSGYSLLFLDVDARAGYVLPWIEYPWRLTLMGGIYYATTFASTQSALQFGYANAMGPELRPMITRELDSGAEISLYVNVAPVMDQFSLLSLSNHELAAEASYLFAPDEKGRSFSVFMNWTNLAAEEDGINASATTFTLGADYHW